MQVWWVGSMASGQVRGCVGSGKAALRVHWAVQQGSSLIVWWELSLLPTSRAWSSARAVPHQALQFG